MQLQLGLFPLVLTASALAAPVAKQASSEVTCNALYDGTMVLDMVRPTAEHGTRLSANKVGKYDRRMVLYDDGPKGSVRVTFAKCKAPGLPKKGDRDEAFGRLELKDTPGTCITHVAGQREHEVALGLAKCRTQADAKQKHQWFSSTWNGDYTEPAVVSALGPDGKTSYTQWRMEDNDGQNVLTLTNNRVKFGHYNALHLRDVA